MKRWQARCCSTMILAAALLLASAAQFAGAPRAAAQSEPAEDKAKALKYLESTKKQILDATKGLSDAQWNFKSGSDRWSVAQVMEHIAIAEDFIRGNIVDNVMKAPPPDMTGRDVAKIDAGVLAMVPDRSHKINAPEPMVPKNQFGSPAGSIQHFIDSRAKTEALLENTPDLRLHATDSPTGGVKLDAYEWVLLVGAHSERHLKQILEVKADPNYPKS
jgi:DinB family protein